MVNLRPLRRPVNVMSARRPLARRWARDSSRCLSGGLTTRFQTAKKRREGTPRVFPWVLRSVLAKADRMRRAGDLQEDDDGEVDDERSVVGLEVEPALAALDRLAQPRELVVGQPSGDDLRHPEPDLDFLAFRHLSVPPRVGRSRSGRSPSSAGARTR